MKRFSDGRRGSSIGLKDGLCPSPRSVGGGEGVESSSTREATTMDSMPIREMPAVTSNDVHKSTDPDTKVSHVEDANTSAISIQHVEHHEHLPKGLHQTDDEKSKKWFVGSIDQGTTSSRFLIFDGEGTPVASHQIEFENIYPESG